MKTQNIISQLVLLSLAFVLSACEPPTPQSQSIVVPDYSRQIDLTNWQSRVSTLNVWGLPVISKDKPERMPAIGKAIAAKDIDVALFDEAWLREGRDMIAGNAQKPYRHEATFKGAPLDSGLMFLSNTAISRNSFRPFQLFGPVVLPDAWAVKGIGMITTQVHGLPISYFATHMLAGLSRGSDTRSALTPEWKGEMFELMTHVIEQTDSDSFVIAGDFNIHFGDEEYDYWKRLTSLDGALLEETEGLCTWCKENTYAGSKSKQIDYIFVSPRLNIKSAWVDFKEKVKVGDKLKSLSDHFGLIADLTAVIGDSQKDPIMVRQKFRESVLELKQELTNYRNEKMQDEQEMQARLDVQEKGLDERLCLSCRIDTTLKTIDNYEQALDAPQSSLTAEQLVIRTRLESYFNIFK